MERAGKGRTVWLRLTVDESVVLQAIFQACLEAGGDPNMIKPLALKLKQAKARQESVEHHRGGS